MSGPLDFVLSSACGIGEIAMRMFIRLGALAALFSTLAFAASDAQPARAPLPPPPAATAPAPHMGPLFRNLMRPQRQSQPQHSNPGTAQGVKLMDGGRALMWNDTLYVRGRHPSASRPARCRD